VIGTFLYVTFVLMVTGAYRQTEKESSRLIVIPLVLFICRTIAFQTQSLNPTLALGLGLVNAIYNPDTLSAWQNSWVILAGPSLGGILAGLFMEFLYEPLLAHVRTVRAGQHIFNVIEP
jgi:glycerol uptake facilitator-like aquaporin